MDQDEENSTGGELGGEIVPFDVAGALAEVLPAPGGAPNEHAYRPELAAAVCWEVAGGMGQRAACKKVGVNPSTFGYWLLRLPDVEKMYRAARRLAAMSHFDTALEQVQELIARKASASASEVRATDVAITALQKIAEVLNPSEFSTRQPVLPALMVKIVTTLNLDGTMGPPSQDGSDIYTRAQNTLGTVIEVPGKISVEGQEGAVSTSVTGPADVNARQRMKRQTKRMATPKTYERTVQEGSSDEDGV